MVKVNTVKYMNMLQEFIISILLNSIYDRIFIMIYRTMLSSIVYAIHSDTYIYIVTWPSSLAKLATCLCTSWSNCVNKTESFLCKYFCSYCIRYLLYIICGQFYIIENINAPFRYVLLHIILVIGLHYPGKLVKVNVLF